MKNWCIFVLVCLAWIAAPLAAQTQITIDLAQSGNCGHRYSVRPVGRWYPGMLNEQGPTDEELFKGASKSAAKGDAEAAFQLGLAYLQGVGTPQNLALAEYWFKLGAAKTADKSLVGSFYGQGYCFARDPKKAAQWFEAAGRPGDLFELAQVYSSSIPQQTHEAATLYLQLLTMADAPEVRRAQMELGNLMIDGKYSAGDDSAGHARNLEWARIIAQELLGQEEHNIAVDYLVGRDGLPMDGAMSLEFLRRAARYNIDLAQEGYGEAILKHEVPDTSPLEGYAWIRLASDKQASQKIAVQQMEHQMSPNQLADATAIFEGLVETHAHSGAYYPSNDPLNQPSTEALAKMPTDDPDVQLRRAFALESSVDPEAYQEALQLYRTVRDRRKMDMRVVLGRDYLFGLNGRRHDTDIAHYWFYVGAWEGSRPAAMMLARLYQGEGGALPDPVQAFAWSALADPSSAPPSGLSPEQQEAAKEQIAAWRSVHSGW